MDIREITIHGMEGAVLVAMIVRALTTAGLPSKQAPLAALITGFGVATLYVLEPLYPQVLGPVLDVLIYGLVLGVGASGVYSQLTAAKRSEKQEAQVDAAFSDGFSEGQKHVIDTAPTAPVVVVTPSESERNK